MDIHPNRIAAWVAEEILPHEAAVRSWLIRHWRTAIDVDDVIQEAYCRISELESVEHIRNGRSYFFTTARAIAIDTIRSARHKNSVSMTETEWLYVIDEGPLPDRAVEAGQKLEQTADLLSHLSWTCRQVIELRRIHGLSQAETARQLGVSENVVENHIVRGIRRLLNAISEQEAHATGEGKQGWINSIQTGSQTKRQRGGRPA